MIILTAIFVNILVISVWLAYKSKPSIELPVTPMFKGGEHVFFRIGNAEGTVLNTDHYHHAWFYTVWFEDSSGGKYTIVCEEKTLLMQPWKTSHKDSK